MTKHTIIILTLDEAWERIARVFRDYLVNDKENTLELVSEGMLSSIPARKNLTPKELADIFGEQNLGEPIAKEHKVDIVAIQLGEYDLDIVWHIENKAPEERAEFQPEAIRDTGPPEERF